MVNIYHYEVLEYFQRLTGHKLKDLASVVFYDISYVSKWVNGHNLPAKSHYKTVNEALARLFSKTIYEKNLTNVVDLFENVKFKVKSLNDIYLATYSVINEAYFYTLSDDLEDFLPDDGFISTGRSDILKLIYSVFSLSTTNDEIDVYSTLDIKIILDFADHVKELILFPSNHSTFNYLVSDPKDIFRGGSPEYIMEIINEYNFYDIKITSEDPIMI